MNEYVKIKLFRPGTKVTPTKKFRGLYNKMDLSDVYVVKSFLKEVDHVILCGGKYDEERWHIDHLEVVNE